MAKITRYTKDSAGQYLLPLAAIVIIAWLAVAGLIVSYPAGAQQAVPGSGALWYYLGVPLVGALWGLASYERTPGSYKTRKMAAAVMGLQGSAVGFLVWLVVFAFRNQDILSRILLGQ